MPDEGHHEKMISVQGLRLFVREQGDGHPLLLINGLGADSRMWEHPERILARRSRTIVFDSPGTGQSETPLLPRSLPALARHRHELARRARPPAGRRPRFLLRRHPRPAAREGRPGPGSAARARLDLLRLGSDSRRAAGAPPRGSARPHRLEPARLRLPAVGPGRMDEPAVAAIDRQPRRSSSPARTTCSSRPRTPCSSHVRSRTRACISYPGPSTSTCSARRARARGCWRSSSPPSSLESSTAWTTGLPATDDFWDAAA